LSGGERRRVELARLLATSPRFVLLDEPFTGIDPIMVHDIQTFVCSLKEKGIGILITDHRVQETLRITDRAYILHDGRVLHEGTPEELVANAEVKQVYLGEGFNLS
jgi:lipopolysaccharide export system ATP-binding protein